MFLRVWPRWKTQCVIMWGYSVLGGLDWTLALLNLGAMEVCAIGLLLLHYVIHLFVIWKKNSHGIPFTLLSISTLTDANMCQKSE